MFAPIWNGYYPEENHVGYVTNGVHFPTWAATEWIKLYTQAISTESFHERPEQSKDLGGYL
jgi:starch phosphorylase